MKTSRAPRCMVDPRLAVAVAAEEPWEWDCPRCGLHGQGGCRGRLAHYATVHPDQADGAS